MSDMDTADLRISLSGKKITILGAGTSGTSLAELARRAGADVFVSDAAELSGEKLDHLRELGIDHESGGHTGKVLDADEVVVGSGFPQNADILTRVKQHGISPKGELDFVMPFLDGRFVGITGSNGKTTTTSLLGYLMKSAGLDAMTVGNIGTPIASAAYRSCDVIVAELSSFQLHWANCVQLDAAIVTNFAPDHINWHGSYEKYVAAKAKITSFVKETGFAIVQKSDADLFPSLPKRTMKLSWSDTDERDLISLDKKNKKAFLNGAELFAFDETNLIGSHNIENIAMAIAAAEGLGVAHGAPRKMLASYVPPPHRCALVATHDGIRFVDDSKGTNIAATSAALSSIDGKKVIILGGQGKGEDYSLLLGPLRDSAKYAVLIGEEKQKIADALAAGGWKSFSFVDRMEDAVSEAARRASSGDVVLLSPACTSWDMYKNYGERGDHFAESVMRYISAITR